MDTLMFSDPGLIALWVALLCATGAGLWRLSVGPTTLDRLLGFDMVTITGAALVLVFSAATHSTDYIEFVMVLTALGFFTTVAYYYYLMQLRPEDEEFDVREEP